MTSFAPNRFPAATIDLRFADELPALEISLDESIESNEDNVESPLHSTEAHIENSVRFIQPMPILCTPIPSSVEYLSIPGFRPSVRLHPRFDNDLRPQYGTKVSCEQQNLDLHDFQNVILPSIPMSDPSDVHSISEQSYMDTHYERWDSRCTSKANYIDDVMDFWPSKIPPLLSNLDDDTDSEDEIVMEYNRKLPTLKLRRSSRPVFWNH